MSYDLLVIGGGINGTAIARDAAGRGLATLLVERDDLAAHTSSASSKLIHGGLRYLEQFAFRLVHESLQERAVLLQTAPHIVRPLRFVLPVARGMRPWWMIRAGLMLYDLLAHGSSLPRTRTVRDPALTAPLAKAAHAFAYWDAWVDDARLVALNALDARERGAEIAIRTALVSAARDGDAWSAKLSDGRTVRAAAIVNAAGPWVAEVLGQRLAESAESKVRLVKGSHIVVPRLFDGDHAYILQQPDGRVVFAIAYERDFTLVGTTDVPVEAPDDTAPSADEERYLCEAVDRYFRRAVTPSDIVWRYAGIRALHDDGAADAKAVTRDYHLELDADPGPKLLSVFGGKITTARALAEEALETLGVVAPAWTADAPLPGGDFADFAALDAATAARYPWLGDTQRRRLLRAYGTRVETLIGGAHSLGGDFGAGLSAAEIAYLRTHEFARDAEDVLWRRTKCGLHMTAAQREAVATFLTGA
ncbi:glycerol-3-phosphate dehydrogenase [Allosphingosinicella indica]|uniref:Homodimeric glycerol 3-phosphate dehydrogenase (Quinone) n=1 Tax=Allosphingosinicella indica TaxID=941907 RepID=A0A1X7H3M7_9SPHN|nr:glycerol-3-phosphate dehydrogenase [Allosphingosinicella indica]SMF78668.1 homodimeric glycerol 3-phosphate dehydrogenase (quinone) [Allosphingosinicella indica]